jgi:hypothetical protein
MIVGYGSAKLMKVADCACCFLYTLKNKIKIVNEKVFIFNIVKNVSEKLQITFSKQI